MARFNDLSAVNRFTSACSSIIYRDDLFGPQYYGNSFVCEPVHNLVHREVLHAEGVVFHSRRADDERLSEFLASTDNWSRPVMVRTGPDGALWIADMYRQVLEHPQWIPKEWQQRLDLRPATTRAASIARTRSAKRLDRCRDSIGSTRPDWSRRSTVPAAGSETWRNNCSFIAAIRPRRRC